MRKYELTKGQVAYLHSVEAVKENIEEWFPEFKKPELKVGEWYKGDEKWLCFFTSFEQKNGYVKRNYYGLIDGNWHIDYTASNKLDKYWTLATEQEVTKALTKEAVKRGFKEGVKVKCIATNKKHNLSLSRLDFWYKDNDAYMGGAKIFDNGIWAEVIENTLPSDVESLALKYGKEELIKLLKL